MIRLTVFRSRATAFDNRHTKPLVIYVTYKQLQLRLNGRQMKSWAMDETQMGLAAAGATSVVLMLSAWLAGPLVPFLQGDTQPHSPYQEPGGTVPALTNTSPVSTPDRDHVNTADNAQHPIQPEAASTVAGSATAVPRTPKSKPQSVRTTSHTSPRENTANVEGHDRTPDSPRSRDNQERHRNQGANERPDPIPLTPTMPVTGDNL